MIITVRGVDWNHPHAVGLKSEAFWVEFASVLTSGQALLVPKGGGVRYFNGQDLSVETDQHAVEGLRVLVPGERHEPDLVRLPRRGDYLVTGQVQSVTVDEESGEPLVFDIWVGAAASFAVSPEDVGEQGLSRGVASRDWVSFRAVGLLLYEEGM